MGRPAGAFNVCDLMLYRTLVVYGHSGASADVFLHLRGDREALTAAA